MNNHRKIQTLAFASLFATVFSASAFAQSGQLPASVPSQQMMQPPQQAIPAEQPYAAPSMAPAPIPAPGPASQAAPQTAMPPTLAPSSTVTNVPASTLPPGGKTAPQSALSPHPNAPLQPKQVGDVTYITGGVGDKEMDQLKAEAPNYNLQIMNSDGTGHFVATNELVITSKDGRELIRVDNSGPLFYAQLPPGDYKLEVMHGDKHETRNVKVSSKGKAANVYLIWR